MRPLVECVSNFAEARRPEVVDAIVDAIRSAGSADVQVLNVSSDNDLNRTTVIFAGQPAEVEAAAFAGIAKAVELIDLNHRADEPPLVGAAEMVTIIPIRDINLTDGVALARRLGALVGSELNLPVYLVEAAAARPERENADNLRRLQFEALKAEIASNPAREPDFGPRQLGPAGAALIGAQAFLIAFNISLGTADVGIARKAAQAVRQAWGGVRHLKAQGALVEGQAQVCLSLANAAQAPLARVVEFVRREVERYGVSLTRTEVVGLIPQAALIDAAQWYLQLDSLEADQILDNPSAPAAHEATPAPPEAGFLEQLAAGTATPGGGAATAYAGAMAAALVSMVARLTIGKKKYATLEAQMQSVLDSAERLRADMAAAVQDDAAAYEAVLAAFKPPADAADEDQPARADAIEQAYVHASEVPLRTARNAVAILGLAQMAAEKGNLNAIADAASAGHLARAALAGAALNVRMNAAVLKDRQTVAAWLKELVGLEARAGDALAAIERTVRERKPA